MVMRWVAQLGGAVILGICFVGICFSPRFMATAQVKQPIALLQQSSLPSAVLRPAPLIQMPGVAVPERSLDHEADSNNPLHWDGDTLYLFNNAGHPWRTSGPDIEHLGGRISVDMGVQNNKMNLWIESTWKDDDGTLYGAYHYEPDTICFSNQHILTAPRIGWIRSHDNGATREDLGVI